MKPKTYAVVGYWNDTGQTFVHHHETSDAAYACIAALEYNASCLSSGGLVEADDDRLERAVALTSILAVFEDHHVNMLDESEYRQRWVRPTDCQIEIWILTVLSVVRTCEADWHLVGVSPPVAPRHL